MLNLIRADIFRLIRSKSIYIVFAVMLFMCILSAATIQPGTLGTANASAMDEMQSYVEEDDIETTRISEFINALDERRTDEQKKAFVLEVIGSNMNLYYLIIFIVYGVLAADFSNKSIKNTLTSITSKKKYFASKTLFISVVSLLFISINTFVFYGLNYAINGEKYSCTLSRAVSATVLQIPLLMGLTSLLILAVFIFRNGAAFTSIAIIGVLVFQLFFSIISEVSNWKCIDTFLRKYEVQGALYKLAADPEQHHTIICCIIGTVMFIASTAAGYKVFKKAEIK